MSASTASAASASQVLVVMIETPPSAADALARALVEARAAACVNRLPNVTSTYRWAGKVEVDSEELLLVKTTRGAYPRLEAVVAREHPYDTPEIVGMRVDVGSETYLAWVRENVDSGEE